MKLFVFSHRQETFYFLQEYKFRPAMVMSDYFYVNENLALLITGEHPLQVAARVSMALSFLGSQCNSVYHLGLALVLDPNSPRLVYPVSNIKISYGADGKNPWQKSFVLGIEDGCDIISLGHRLYSEEDICFFRRFAALADRETYAIATVSEEAGKQLYVAKYLLQPGEDSDHCREVKNRSEQIAYELFQYAKSLNSLTDNETHKQEILVPEGFYLTHSMRLKYTELLSILEKKYNWNTQEILRRADIEKIRQEQANPKDRGLSLLNSLQQMVNPEIYEIRQRYERKLAPLRKAGWRVDALQSLEQSALILSGKIGNREQLYAMGHALLQFSDNPDAF